MALAVATMGIAAAPVPLAMADAPGAAVAPPSAAAAPPSAAAAPPARTRLEAVHGSVSWKHVDGDTRLAPNLGIEVGRLLTHSIGLSGLARFERYNTSMYGDTSGQRTEVYVGPRIYTLLADRFLFAVGGGKIIGRNGYDYEGQFFAEVYAAVTFARGPSTELEIGAIGGLAASNDLHWAGLSLGVRQRAW